MNTLRPRLMPTFARATATSLTHWRPLLLWWLASLLPSLLATLPVWAWFNGLFAHSALSRRVANGDLAVVIDAMMQPQQLGFATSVPFLLLSWGLVAMLLSPWLTGMVVAELRAGHRLGFGELIRGGFSEYGRMFRVWLLAMVLFGVVGMLASFAFGGIMAGSSIGAEARPFAKAQEWAGIGTMIGFALVYASIEAGRAAFAADPTLRSAFRGWARGFLFWKRRPFSMLLLFVLTLAVAFLFMAWAQRGVFVRGSSAALLLAQLAVLVMAWMRITRLRAMAWLHPNAAQAAKIVAPVEAPVLPVEAAVPPVIEASA